MENHKYSCRVEYTKDLIIEMTSHSRKKIYVAVVYFMYVVLGCLEAALIYFNGFRMMDVAILSLFGISIPVNFLMPRWHGIKQWKAAQEMYQGNMITNVLISEEGICHRNENTGAEQQLGYSEIYRMVETKNLFLLILEENTALVVDKARIIGGDAKELREFLIEKQR